MTGIKKILSSYKATFCLIVLVVCTFIAIINKMTPSFAACISSVTSVLIYARSKQQTAMLSNQTNTGSLMAGTNLPIPGAINE
jgi:hypothetical protein